ncbi:hypothetical protein MMC26_002094 [Xylographa opegraphella]|nr:hypothetical protein [Xylographa opegraphella]
MPLTDSEATSGGFYVGVVGLVLAAVEFLIVWGRRGYGLLAYARLTTGEASLTVAEARLTTAEAGLTTAEACLTAAEDLLGAERQAHQTTVHELAETHRNELAKLQNDRMVEAEARYRASEARNREERAERMLLLRLVRRRR